MNGEIIAANGTVLLALPSRANTALVRNHDMVHRRDCYRISGVMVNPWQWAEGLPIEDIASAAENGLKFCRSCDPLGRKNVPAVSS